MRALAGKQKDRLENEIQELQDELQNLKDKHWKEVSLRYVRTSYPLVYLSLVSGLGSRPRSQVALLVEAHLRILPLSLGLVSGAPLIHYIKFVFVISVSVQ